MKRNRKSGNKNPLKKWLKNFSTSYEAIEAKMLDHAQERKGNTPASGHEAPPGEFEQIIAAMEERGIVSPLNKQLESKRWNKKSRIFFRKPVVVGMLVVILVGGTSMGVSAKKAYDFKMRERDPGKSDIVWNNDDSILIMDSTGIDRAYKEIEENLAFSSLKLNYMPLEIRFIGVEVKNNIAVLKFDYEGNIVVFLQTKYPYEASSNISSDRINCEEVYNSRIEQNIEIRKNQLSDGTTEYNAAFTVGGVSCYIAGKLPQEKLAQILKYLGY